MYGSNSSIINISISRVLDMAYPIHTQMIGYGDNGYEVKKNISRNERVTKSNKKQKSLGYLRKERTKKTTTKINDRPQDRIYIGKNIIFSEVCTVPTNTLIDNNYNNSTITDYSIRGNVNGNKGFIRWE
jgi:hypothetical protein